MKTTVTFTPARNPAHPNKTPFSPINGLQVAYGLVIHPAINSSIRHERGYWDVSDPGSGCLVAYGEYPGPEGAIAGLVQRAMDFKTRPGGFRGALERGRRLIANGPQQQTSSQPSTPVRVSPSKRKATP